VACLGALLKGRRKKVRLEVGGEARWETWRMITQGSGKEANKKKRGCEKC